MTTFNLKQVTTPLFGHVETRTERWLNDFSTGIATTVTLDSAALDMIANELGLDGRGLAFDAELYVNGEYKPKARGMSGSTLGDLGEILTYLVKRAEPNCQMIRVVHWRPAEGQPIKGSRFPQPDFIFVDATGASAALEVKSTQAFDFIDLRDTQKKWMYLQPCAAAIGCRKEALPQLGYIDGHRQQPPHLLEANDKSILPFPVGKGIAMAVIAIDGRVPAESKTGGLRDNKKLKTPKDCRTAKRDCWTCISPTTHFVLVTMPNAPGALSLAGAAPDQSWARAYKRWSQALASRDLPALKSTLKPLVNSLSEWLSQPKFQRAELLRAFWGSYLNDSMRGRGFNVELPGQLGDLSGFEEGWRPVPVPSRENRETDLQELRSIFASQRPLPQSALSTRPLNDGQNQTSLSLGIVGDFIEFRFSSETWWHSEEVTNDEVASRIATSLCRLVFELMSGVYLQHVRIYEDLFEMTLQEVIARVGDRTVSLGWSLRRRTIADLPHFLFWYPYERNQEWPVHLWLGDQNVTLRVLRDGRATLRIHKELLAG